MLRIKMALIGILAISITNAQTFTWTPNDSIVQDIDANSTAVLKMEQEVIGPDDTLQLKARVIYNDIPATWDGMLCIQGLCTGMIAPVNTENFMSLIDTSINGYVRLTLNPMGETGTVKYQVYVFDIDHPNDGDTATWILNSIDYTNVENIEVPELKVFPVPTSGTINLVSDELVDEVTIYNLSGQVVFSEKRLLSNNLSFELEHLSPGTYLAEINTISGYRKTNKISIE